VAANFLGMAAAFIADATSLVRAAGALHPGTVCRQRVQGIG
jgi:hypothetical protein